MTKASLLIIITKYKFVVSNKSREEVLYIYIDKNQLFNCIFNLNECIHMNQPMKCRSYALCVVYIHGSVS